MKDYAWFTLGMVGLMCAVIGYGLILGGFWWGVLLVLLGFVLVGAPLLLWVPRW